MTSQGRSIDEAWSIGTPAVIGYDAGAAAHAIAWLMDDPRGRRSAIIHFQGPARRLAESRGLSVTEDLAETFSAGDWALVGTGWQSDLERQAMRICASEGKPCVAILDHWVNYPDRFTGLHPGERPQLVVVTDPVANRQALQQLPWATVVEWPNIQRDALVKRVAQLRDSNADYEPYILWVQEQIRDKGGRLSDPLADSRYAPSIWNSLKRVANARGLNRLVIRSHPAQDRASYGADGLYVEVHDGREVPLADDLAGADLCVGLKSYALYLAVEAGVETASLAHLISGASRMPAGLIPQDPETPIGSP